MTRYAIGSIPTDSPVVTGTWALREANGGAAGRA